MNVKKGDTVKVIAGKDKGKEGEVMSALPKKGRVVVEKVNVVKKAQVATSVNPQKASARTNPQKASARTR